MTVKEINIASYWHKNWAETVTFPLLLFLNCYCYGYWAYISHAKIMFQFPLTETAPAMMNSCLGLD